MNDFRWEKVRPDTSVIIILSVVAMSSYMSCIEGLFRPCESPIGHQRSFMDVRFGVILLNIRRFMLLAGKNILYEHSPAIIKSKQSSSGIISNHFRLWPIILL